MLHDSPPYYDMFYKGVGLQIRMMDMKRGALQAGRSLIGRLHVVYGNARHLAHAVGRGHNMFSKIHKRVAPALMDSASGVAKTAQKVMGSYEATRKAVQGADT
jgi:fructose-1,6-bisphosphatase